LATVCVHIHSDYTQSGVSSLVRRGVKGRPHWPCTCKWLWIRLCSKYLYNAVGYLLW